MTDSINPLELSAGQVLLANADFYMEGSVIADKWLTTGRFYTIHAVISREENFAVYEFKSDICESHLIDNEDIEKFFSIVSMEGEGS